MGARQFYIITNITISSWIIATIKNCLIIVLEKITSYNFEDLRRHNKIYYLQSSGQFR